MKKNILSWILLQLVSFSMVCFAQVKPAKIVTTPITTNIYSFFLNDFVNVIAFVGTEGVLLIDTGFDNTPAISGFSNSAEAIKEELKKLGYSNIKFVINTHYNFDHTFGNTLLGEKATIIAHHLCREQLAREAQFPKTGLPQVTFRDSINLYFNGEEISLYYMPGHTKSDIIVWFKNSKVICLGDLVISDSFTSIQFDGNANRLGKSLQAIYEKFPDDITFLPAHGRKLNRSELKANADMVLETTAIITKAIQEKMSLLTMKRLNILNDYEKWNGQLFKQLTADRWIDYVYFSIHGSEVFSVATQLGEIIDKSGLDAGLAECKELYTENGDGYYFSEFEFNNLGYKLLGESKVKEAIEIFKFNTVMYPTSWNVYDSLGEGYWNLKDKKHTVANYEQSLKLNPANTNASKMLDKIRNAK